MPTPTRIRNSTPKLGARPQSAVNADHTVMQIAMMLTRLNRSASRAIGMPSTV